ncbi:MAG: hypothetical protein M1834_004917 [Cirrosporium novae-zelandiae]|nr:MAG: hypothetical protein M1834_004917 [Cirrosporium novae-zelandiae]
MPRRPKVPVLYDDTHRGCHGSASVHSMANNATLIGYLQHHFSSTDGSFSICIAGGQGNVVSKTLYESIPEANRPTLDTQDTPEVDFLIGPSQKALGSIIMPIVLRNRDTGKKFCIKLYAFVIEHLLMGMFIGASNDWLLCDQGGTPRTYICDFGNGTRTVIEQISH